MSTSLGIPEELVEQLERGNVVLLLGAGLAQGGDGERGLPTNNELAQELARRSSYSENNLILSHVAQHYELKEGRHALLSLLRERLLDLYTQPLTVHRMLATYPWRVVVTTCLDNLFERALTEAVCPYLSVVANTDIPYMDQDTLLLVRMNGSLEQPDSVVVTKLDYLRWQHQIENILILLKGLIFSRTLLILGQDLEDEYLMDLYGRVILPFRRNVRRSYAVTRQVSPHIAALWEQLNVQIITSDDTVFVKQLLEQASSRSASKTHLLIHSAYIAPAPIPLQPYKFLNSYEESDRSIFFGREKEKAHILSKIASFRIVVLHGKSGTGKTSMIKAGLMPDLRERDYSVVYSRILTNPIDSIETAFNQALNVHLPHESSLHGFLLKALTGSKGTEVLFLDQFEELFTDQFDTVTRLEFLNTLGEIYVDTSLDLKIVIAIREDALAELSTLKRHIPEIFYNDYHLELLGTEQARQAIVNPVEQYGIRYEEGLVEEILRDLGGEIDPPQLQIVCDRLYAQRELQAKVITHAQYASLGGASSMLAGYLDDVLNQYPEAERVNIQSVLKEFITTDTRRAIPTLQDLTQHTGLSSVDVQKVLDDLEEARLIREVPPEPHFELVHEYLISEIASWTNEEERAQKRAQEMLEQGLLRWKNFQILLSRAELAIINAQRASLKLTEETLTLLVCSAVWTDLDVEYWLQQGTPEVRRLALQTALMDSESERRHRAAQYVGRFMMMDMIPTLQHLVEGDPSPDVFCEAACSWARMDPEQYLRHVQDGLHGPPNRQKRILEALDYIQNAVPEVPKVDLLTRPILRWRLRQFRLRRNRAKRNQVTTLCTIGGALGAMIGGTIGGFISVALSLPDAQMGYLPLMLMLSLIVGLAIGAGVGFGYGMVRAMDERHMFVYINSAILGGGIGGLLVGIIGDTTSLDKALLGGAVGLLGGMTSGGGAATIISWTQGIEQQFRRLMMRLAFGIMIGVIPGLIFIAGGLKEVFLPWWPYDLGIGVMMTSGIVGALELSERAMGRTSQAGVKSTVDKADTRIMEGKGG